MSPASATSRRKGVSVWNGGWMFIVFLLSGLGFRWVAAGIAHEAPDCVSLPEPQAFADLHGVRGLGDVSHAQPKGLVNQEHG